MLNVLLLVMIITLMGILWALNDIAQSLRTACKKLDQYVNCMFIVKKADPHHALGPKIAVVFSIWCFEDGNWTLLSQCGQPGCECGPPPAKAGSYEGQVIRKECPAR
jgi:hypothetical protein